MAATTAPTPGGRDDTSPDPARAGEARAQLLASIVDSARDAIVGTDLNGTITNWNDGAARLLGYTEIEVVGLSMMTMIPTDRHASELQHLARVHLGERVAPYATVRQHKDGHFVDLSATLSPITTADGSPVGTSMIARDIAEAGYTQDLRTQLFREIRHRTRNLFAVVSGIVALSARFAQTPQDMVGTVRNRLDALARAHDLTLPTLADAPDQTDMRTTLHLLIRAIIAPYDDAGQDGAGRVAIHGPDVPIGMGAATSLALLLNEFAMNVARNGAFLSPAGRVDVTCEVIGDELRVAWQERGSPAHQGPVLRESFGTLLGDATVRRQLGGSIAHQWTPEGLTIHLILPLARLTI